MMQGICSSCSCQIVVFKTSYGHNIATLQLSHRRYTPVYRAGAAHPRLIRRESGTSTPCHLEQGAIMQAVVINKTGGIEVLEYVHNFPIPERQPGQVLVKLQSSSVNPVDTAVRAGFIPPQKFPKVLGGDLAGVVTEADDNSKFKKGDHVAALTPGFYNTTPEGTYCQYVAVEESQLAKLPGSIPLSTAAGLPLVGLTAWQALMEAKPVQGQRVLVFAASGGVGHVAVQIAKVLGLHVVGVAGPKNTSWVKESLGAAEVVDYSSQDFASLYSSPDKQFDIVVDCLGNSPERQAQILSVLKPTGHYSHILNTGTDQDGLDQIVKDSKGGNRPTASFTIVTPEGGQLERLFGLWEAGKLNLEVAEVFDLKDVADAHKQVETGHTRGKIVLAIPQ